MAVRVRLALAIVAAAALLTVLGLALAARGQDDGGLAATSAPSQFAGPTVPADYRLPTFRLSDQDGRRVSLAQFRGQVVVLTFLYTHCQDTCPIMLQQIRGALDDLPKGGRDVAVVAISVDPANDTPLSARRFIYDQSMTGRMHYLLGSRSTLQPIWKSQGIQPQSAKSEHSAFVFVLDRQGRERVGFPAHYLTPEDLAHDIRVLQRAPA